MVSHIEVCLPEKPLKLNNIGGDLKAPQRKLQKEDLFLQYDKNKCVSIISAPIPIKPLTYETKFLSTLIAPTIK